LGFFWISSTLSGYIATFSVLVLGFVKQLQTGHDQHLILGSLISGICHIVFLTAFTVFQKENIRVFINQIMGIETPSAEPKPLRIKLQKDSYNLPSHIVMFSSSYFLTLNQSFKLKDKEKLKDFQKKILLIKNGNSEKSHRTPLIKENRLSYNKKPRPLIIPSRHSLDSRSPFPHECFSAIQTRQQTKVLNPFEKLCFTADDLDYAKQIDYKDFLSNLQNSSSQKTSIRKR